MYLDLNVFYMTLTENASWYIKIEVLHPDSIVFLESSTPNRRRSEKDHGCSQLK